MFLLDTNVISELRAGKRSPSASVRLWAAQLPSNLLYLSAVTVLELETGVQLMERKDRKQGQQLRVWLDALLETFSAQILPFGRETATLCAALHVPDRRPDRDAMIAATAKEHSLTLATRNVADFQNCGIALYDPWATTRSIRQLSEKKPSEPLDGASRPLKPCTPLHPETYTRAHPGKVLCPMRFALPLCLFAVLSAPVLLPAQQPLPPQPRTPPLMLGAAWYPEQWPESRWDADLTLMQQAGITFVRVGEFSWSTMEPSEGNYQFGWLGQAIRAAEKHGIAVVLGTPGAAPPAWLTTNYPDTMRTMEDGRKDVHGNREQFNFTSPKYREMLTKITTQMATRFGHDPNVIAWQLDNEIGEQSYDAGTRAQFQQWLRARYKTLDALNARWTTAYWSETYQDWSQIPLGEQPGNPGLMLAWKRFVSDTWRGYDRVQIDAIRAHSEPRQIITTNTMGWFDRFDHYTVEQDLDFAAWDDYVGTGHLDPVRNGATHDLTRGFKRRNFWVMETQPGMVNWSNDNNMLDKGEVRAMAWNAVGHGAQAVEYWQWRSALNGQEQYHGTLLGADGTPVPLYAEVQQVGAEFAKAGPALAGTTVHSQVAVLNDYDSRWAVNWQRHNKAFDPVTAIVSIYGPLRALARSVDIVQDTAPLQQYKLVVAPALNVITPAAAANLKAYVEGGGHLVLTQRSGMKDDDNTLYPERQPGPLADLLGARVEQWYALEKPVPVSGAWGSGEDTVWAEQLGSLKPGTETLLTYGKSNGWLDGQPAAVTRTVGKGRITYIGAALSGDVLQHAAAWMLETSGVATVLPGLPAGIDAAVLSGNGKRITILTNYAAAPQSVTLPGSMTDVLTGGTVTSVSLPQYGVAVLQAKDGGQ